MKKFISYIVITILIFTSYCFNSNAEGENDLLSLNCPSAILMDYESGEVLYEKNPDEIRAMASVTKIMTLLICMEEINAGNISYDDIVTGSANAKSYGGSTIFLDEGEKISVRDLLKGIAVASGNDASVAMAEYVSGSESAFVLRMNETAKRLGMINTNFVNCNGLDEDGHYSTARDIAIMSRELMKYNDIFQFTTIWMDSLRNGTFTLSNTNKLIKYYDGATGLKTGSTDNARFCISATAKRDNMHLIAVIMGAETSKLRQADAVTLLNYGFNNYLSETIVDSENYSRIISVEKGEKNSVAIIPKSDYCIVKEKNCDDAFSCKLSLKKRFNAPINKGDCAGYIIIENNGKEVDRVELIFSSSVTKCGFWKQFRNNLLKVF
ncbi:MAG: D-alanyl-D-alanine carboxypeptidase [Clostridia bacterium]|nr:D-alanyl-D-alanine carboxypeptidase [Clostridia bacterium]